MSVFIVVASCLAVPVPAHAHGADAPCVFLLDARQLAHNRDQLRAGDSRFARALEKLKGGAERALNALPQTVVRKTAATSTTT
jgi:hypothetical protein